MNDDQKITWKKNSGTQNLVNNDRATKSDFSVLGDETVLDLATRSADGKTVNKKIDNSENISSLQEDIKKMIANIDDGNSQGAEKAINLVSDTINIDGKNAVNSGATSIDESVAGSSVAAAAMAAIDKKQELSKSVVSEPLSKIDDSAETESQNQETIESIKESITGELGSSEKINKENILDEQTQKLISEKEQKKWVGHTYYSDLSSAMGSNEPATMSELLKKARFEKKSKEIFSPRSRKNMTYIIGALLLLGGIIWIVSSLIARTEKTVEYIKEKRVSSLIYSDMDTGINLTNIESAKIKQAIRKVIETKIPEDTFHQIYYVAKDQLGNTRRVGVKQIFDATGNTPPAILYENIENNFMHGVYKTDKNHPFVLLKALSYDRAFEGMKEWEPTMIDDLATYLDLPKEAGDRSLLEAGFKNDLIKNKNVRVARFLPRESDKRGILDIFKSKVEKTEVEKTTGTQEGNILESEEVQEGDILESESVLENTVVYVQNIISDIIFNSAKLSYAQRILTDYQEIDIDTEIDNPNDSSNLEFAILRCLKSEAKIYEKEKANASITAEQAEINHAIAVEDCNNMTLEDLDIGQGNTVQEPDLTMAIELCLKSEAKIYEKEKKQVQIFIPYFDQMESCNSIDVEDPDYENIFGICQMTAEFTLDGTGYSVNDVVTAEQAEINHTIAVDDCNSMTLEDLNIGQADNIFDGNSIYDDGVYIYEKPRDVLWDIIYQLYLDGISHLYNSHVYIGDAAPIVTPVQEVLALIGLMESVSVTGEMDLVTQDAISLFQEVNGIPQTGVIDPITINMINNIITNQGVIFGNDNIASIDDYISETTPIGLGTYSNDVQEIQILLYVNGYDVSNVNGLFDSELCEALAAYEIENGLPQVNNVGCVISASTIESLNLLIQEGDYLGAGFTITEEEGIGSCNQFDRFIGIGSIGSQVTLLQETLQAQGYYNGDIDGIFDQELLDALHVYQEDSNLPLSGGLNSQTVFSLNQNMSQDGQTSTAFTGLMELGMSSGQISKIQKLLKNQTYFNEDINGILDKNTCESIKKYQSDNSLDISSASNCMLAAETVASLDELYCKVYPSGKIQTMRGFGILDGLFGPGTASFGANVADADSLKEGDIVLIYTFLDEKTILITRHESVITEIIKRRAFNDIFNKS